MSNLEDANMEAHPGEFSLSDDEKRVLDLYDRLQELQLEIALLKARQSHKPEASQGKLD